MVFAQASNINSDFNQTSTTSITHLRQKAVREQMQAIGSATVKTGLTLFEIIKWVGKMLLRLARAGMRLLMRKNNKKALEKKQRKQEYLSQFTSSQASLDDEAIGEQFYTQLEQDLSQSLFVSFLSDCESDTTLRHRVLELMADGQTNELVTLVADYACDHLEKEGHELGFRREQASDVITKALMKSEAIDEPVARGLSNTILNYYPQMDELAKHMDLSRKSKKEIKKILSTSHKKGDAFKSYASAYVCNQLTKNTGQRENLAQKVVQMVAEQVASGRLRQGHDSVVMAQAHAPANRPNPIHDAASKDSTDRDGENNAADNKAAFSRPAS